MLVLIIPLLARDTWKAYVTTTQHYLNVTSHWNGFLLFNSFQNILKIHTLDIKKNPEASYDDDPFQDIRGPIPFMALEFLI